MAVEMRRLALEVREKSGMFCTHFSLEMRKWFQFNKETGRDLGLAEW